MNPVRRAIRQARRRLWLQRWLDVLGWSLLAGVSAGLALVLAERLLAVALPGWWYVALAGVVVTGSLVGAFVRRPSDLAVATMIDDRLHLKDTLSTSLHVVRRQERADPLASQVIAEAQRRATGVRVAGAFGVKMRRMWAWLPPAGAVVAAVFFLLPQQDLLGRLAAKEEEAKQQAQVRQAQEEVKAVLETLPGSADVAMEDEDIAQELAEASDLLKQVTEHDMSSPSAREEAAAKSGAAYERLGEVADRIQERTEEVENMMSRLGTDESGPADDFTRSLRRGQFDEAGEALEALQKNIEQMSDEDRAALKRQLEQLAKQLREEAAREEAEERENALRQALQESGLDPDAARSEAGRLARGEVGPRELEERLREAGMDPKQAEDVSKRVEEKQEQGTKDQSPSGETASRLSDALQQMSQGVDGGQQQPSGQPSGGQTPQQNPGQQSQPQSQPGQQPGSQNQGTQQQNGSQQQNSGQQQSGNQQSGGQQQSGSQQTGGQQQQPNLGQGIPSGQQPAGQQPGGQQPGQSGSQQPGQGAEQQMRPGGGGQGQQQFQDGAGDAQQELQRLSRQQRQVDQLRRGQQQLSRATRQLGNQSPAGGSGGQQPDGGQQMAQQGSRQNDRSDLEGGYGHGGDPVGAERAPMNAGAEVKREDVQNRPGRAIVRWREGGEVGEETPTVDYDEAVSEAKRQSNIAINEDRTPRQYHEAVRRYFDNLPEKGGEPSGEQGGE